MSPSSILLRPASNRALALSTAATQMLGRASSMCGATHLEICRARRLQRVAFAPRMGT